MINKIGTEPLKVNLATKKELEVYMNPTRQQILRLLSIAKEPLTPKALSNQLGISASSVQHHIKLLEELHLLSIHHTSIIKGIQAKYYALNDVVISISGRVNNPNESEALGLQLIQNVVEGYANTLRKLPRDMASDKVCNFGETLIGVVHLEPAHRMELHNMILDFLKKHEVPNETTEAWEYALIAYKVEEV